MKTNQITEERSVQAEDMNQKAYDEEKCRTARIFAACADSYCSDNCNMQCPYEQKDGE